MYALWCRDRIKFSVALVLIFVISFFESAFVVPAPPFALASQSPILMDDPQPTPPSNNPFPLSGTWTGVAKNGNLEMQVRIVLQSSCLSGEICGTFDLSLPCSGNFSLVGENEGVYEFRAVNKSTSCTGEGRDFIELLPDGRLLYVSRGVYGETRGELVRNPAQASKPATLQRIQVFDDDDGSPDGTSALLYLLLKPDVDLVGVGISYGEAHPASYIQHIGRMLDSYGFADIPLGAGMDGSLSGNEGFPEWLRQSADNFWGWPIPNQNKTYPVQEDADLIISLVKQSPEPVTLFFSGPFTNLALALRKDPEIKENIAAVYMMGGAVYIPGNVHDFYPDSKNVYADWNIYSDPQAAKEVFESGLEMVLIPLDATNQVKIDKTDTRQWREGGKIADFTADIYDGLMDSTGKDEFYIWDLMTSVIMLDHSLCEFTPLHLDVVTEETDHFGQTVVAPDEEPNINVCLQPKADLIRQELISTFSMSY